MENVRGKDRAARVIVGAALVFLILVVLAIVFTVVGVGNNVRAEIARIKASGQPVSMKDLAGAPVPDQLNAAVLYAAAFKAMSSPMSEKDNDAFQCVIHPKSGTATPKHGPHLRKRLLLPFGVHTDPSQQI